MSNEQQSYPEVHPLIDGRRVCYGEEEVSTCNDCGRPFLAEEACWSKWNGEPICPRCEALQKAVSE